MTGVKIFVYTNNYEYLEQKINEWLEKHNDKLSSVDIQYRPVYHHNGHVIHYSALITYHGESQCLN